MIHTCNNTFVIPLTFILYILGNLNPFSEWRNPLICKESSRKVLTHMFIIKRVWMLELITKRLTIAGHGGTYSLIAT